MTAASQWLHATTGRITTCPHSWMTAVHWINQLATRGFYTPARKGGPQWGPTTLAVAQEIAALKECRPGVDYLARKLKVCVRTVKYHLGMLRETGLLVYRSKGTRVSGVGGRASEFERVIPASFDEAHGIRTVGEGATRRPVGVAEHARKAIGKLAKKAARKTRRHPRRTPVPGQARCTPMQGGTSASSSAAHTYSPPESKLASGTRKFPTQKSNGSGQNPNEEPQNPNQLPKGRRKLNKVGRRFQMARQLIQTVPWLQKASVPRIAWIIRHVADAGWTLTEIQAAAERMVVDREARRPSAVLAFRLASCHLLYTTPGRRKVLVDDWRDSRLAEQARHSETNDDFAATGPRAIAVRKAVDEAFAEVRERDASAMTELPANEEDRPLEDLSREEVAGMRAAAMKDPGLIYAAIDVIGEDQTRRLYSHLLVDQALALRSIAARRNVLAPAF
ncbi:transcriptional regulator [Streptomyces sp. NPDC060001]|uniref:transcriptional regulator n=1 Tax=Streptomyces sp. NPDC060001 TaxID=3347032 RepID=UPI003683D9E4